MTNSEQRCEIKKEPEPLRTQICRSIFKIFIFPLMDVNNNQTRITITQSTQNRIRTHSNMLYTQNSRINTDTCKVKKRKKIL